MGCEKNVETEDELLQCQALREEGENLNEKYALVNVLQGWCSWQKRLKIDLKSEYFFVDDPG